MQLLFGNQVGGQGDLVLGPAGESNAPGVGGIVNGAAHAGVGAGGLHAALHAPALGDLQNAGHGVLLGGVDGVGDAEGLGQLQPLVHHVHQNRDGVISQSAHAGQQANGPRADNGDVFAGL